MQHDPKFAVYFTGSYQLSKKRRAFKKPVEQDPNSPIIAESSGELSQDKESLLKDDKKKESLSEGGKAPPQRPSIILPKKNDPLSVTDHVAYEGFITDAEIEKITWAFEEAVHLKRELRRARYQEAAKYVKDNLMKGGPRGDDSPRPKSKEA